MSIFTDKYDNRDKMSHVKNDIPLILPAVDQSVLGRPPDDCYMGTEVQSGSLVCTFAVTTIIIKLDSGGKQTPMACLECCLTALVFWSGAIDPTDCVPA